MFDHIQIKVSDLQRSRVFYQKVLGTLGYSVVLEIEDVVVGIGTNAHNMFEIRQAGPDAPLSQSVHVAFVAKSEDDVRRFHAMALHCGATDNGAPGLRPDYEEGYFAAFIVDPDGHNVEAVFSSKQTAD